MAAAMITQIGLTPISHIKMAVKIGIQQFTKEIRALLTKYDREYLTNIVSHVYKQWKDSTTSK